MTATIIFILILVITGFFLIRYASKLLFRALGFVFFIIALFITLYMFNMGPWANNLLARNSIQKKFCIEKETANHDVCKCVVQTYITLLENKFTKEELEKIESSNYESAYIYTQLQDELKKEVKKCAEFEDSTSYLINQFQSQIVPVGKYANAAWEWIMEKASNMSERADRKKEIDEKLEIGQFLE